MSFLSEERRFSALAVASEMDVKDGREPPRARQYLQHKTRCVCFPEHTTLRRHQPDEVHAGSLTLQKYCTSQGCGQAHWNQTRDDGHFKGVVDIEHLLASIAGVRHEWCRLEKYEIRSNCHKASKQNREELLRHVREAARRGQQLLHLTVSGLTSPDAFLHPH